MESIQEMPPKSPSGGSLPQPCSGSTLISGQCWKDPEIPFLPSGKSQVHFHNDLIIERWSDLIKNCIGPLSVNISDITVVAVMYCYIKYF